MLFINRIVCLLQTLLLTFGHDAPLEEAVSVVGILGDYVAIDAIVGRRRSRQQLQLAYAQGIYQSYRCVYIFVVVALKLFLPCFC